MDQIEIKRISITDLETDAIVNAANSGLWKGGGVCGAIFRAAGEAQLQEACNRIGHCDEGAAVITPAFRLKAKYIIHAVGPQWHGGMDGEPEALYSAYYNSLLLAVNNGCRSIGFPLISAGIFGYPVDQAWERAIAACQDFLKNESSSIRIVFAVLDDNIRKVGESILQGSYHSTVSKSASGDTLLLAGKEYPAVYFHLPEEPYGFLSNWYPSPFVLNGIQYSSMEQYIMYCKCMLFGDQTAANAILATDDTAEQKEIGRQAKGYLGPVWDGARQIIAYKGLMAKFAQNEDLKERLLETGDAYLVECAKTDKVWACGIRLTDDRRFDAANWEGENILGFALMAVRDSLG